MIIQTQTREGLKLTLQGQTENQRLTVGQLVTLLRSCPDQNAEVYTEGCDCYGNAVSILANFEGMEETPRILIERGPDRQ